jgi:hypothetical protein
MLLRPATPLSVVLLAAFALMLLAVLSAPVIESIPLAEHEGVTYGVFGYCKGGDGCTSIGIGYDIGTSLCFVSEYAVQPLTSRRGRSSRQVELLQPA